MKKLLFALILLFQSSYFLGQVLYDNGPIVITDPTRFSIHSNKWSSNHLKYFFQNGTNDISGSSERDAVRQAFALWNCTTPLTFSEVNSSSDADIVILWGSGDHGDGSPFDGTDSVLAHAFYPPPNERRNSW